MNEYRRNEVVSGVFVTLAVVLFAGLAFRVVGPEALGIGGGQEVAYVTHLRDAGGLEPGAPVMVAGIPMGRVNTIELTQDRRGDDTLTEARIGFVVTNNQLDVDPQTALAKVSYHGLLGSRFLALEPGVATENAGAARAAQAGVDHPIAIRGVDAPSMAGVLADAGPAIANANRLIDNLDTLVTKNDPLLRNALVELTETTGDLRSKLDTLAGRVDDVLGTMEGTIAENRDHITTLLEELAETSRVARERISGVGDDAERLLTLGSNLIEDNGPEVSETLRRLRRTMWEAEIAMRKVRANPAVLLFGDNEKLYDPTDYDQTWIRDTGRAGIYEQRDE